MKPAKRLGLVAMLVVFGAVLAAPAAMGWHKDYYARDFKLVPPAAGAPEPHAAGTWTFWESYEVPVCIVYVKCRRLTPGETYSVVVYGRHVPATAEPDGRLYAQFQVGTFSDLWVEDDQGNIVLETQH
jgi:hypothetical protein